MRRRLIYPVLLLHMVLITFGAIAQKAVITGKVVDESTLEPLSFVSIGVQGSTTGTNTDANGIYKLELPTGEYTLTISYLGYDKQERRFTVDGKKLITMNIQLSQVMQELSTVVISGSKFEQNVKESTASIQVLKSKSIQYNSPASIDKAIDKMPGITIIDDEPQVRGGSGFSSGMGSRVMVLVNEIPILRGDAGRPIWNFLPMDDVEQIEVLKGASSVIYGSSAITGAINIRTAYAKDKPETIATTFLGMYSRPSRRYTTPWTGENPLQYGASVTHLQKFDNIDMSGGFSYFNDQGYIGAAPEPDESNPAGHGEFNRRSKLFYNIQVRSKKVKGLTYSLNSNVMFGDNAKAFFWYDADTNIYKSYPGALSEFKEFSFYADPCVKYYTKKGNHHSLKNRVYYGNTEATNDKSNRYLTVYNEYQYNQKFSRLGKLTMVAGFMSTFSYSYGQVFSGKLAPDGTTTLNENGTYTSEDLAMYAQFEKKFFNRLKVLFGGRWEHYQIAGLKEDKPIFRSGLNYELTKATFIRGSVGQGYRAPSIGERYITTNTGNFGFYPNPDLKSETILSYDLGVTQLFKFGKFQGMLDVSGFYENYKNYVEFNFGVWGNGAITKSTGFKFLNTGPAQIYGIDGSVSGEGKFLRNGDITLMFGYTYSVPKALEPDLVYHEHFQQTIGKVRQYTYNNTSSDTTGDILKYRMQNVFKSDVQVSFRKRFSTGFTGLYYGYMKNIDIAFYQLEGPGAMHSGIVGYRNEHNKGNFIVDFRVSYIIKNFKLMLLVNNLFNTEYSIRPITVEPPRLTTLKVIFKI